MRRAVLIFAVLILATIFGCGGVGSDRKNTSNISDGVVGSAKLVVSRSKSAETEKSYGVIGKYIVTVSGAGIDEPIVKKFDGTETEGVVDGIPVGESRTIKVEAINIEDKLIREGESASTKVLSREVSNVEVVMDAVPIFVNLRDENVIANNRLRFRLFADPEDPLEVMSVSEGEFKTLFDLSTESDEVYPNVSSGIALFAPENVFIGEQIFKVISKRTGKSSTVKVRLIDGNKIEPAPLFSGGAVADSAEYVGVSRAGSGFYAGPRSGMVWPAVFDAYVNKN